MTTHFSYGELKIFSGRAHPALSQEICAYLGLPLGELTLYNFSDGEDYCQIDENVRGADVFVVQPTSSPVNDHVMELLILLDAFRRSSASRITAVRREAEDRRKASSRIRSSMTWSLTGEQVGWTTNTSAPRTFSSIWQ